MLATHSFRVLNPSSRQMALSSAILADIPKHLICSKTINLRTAIWSACHNIHVMREQRSEAKHINSTLHQGGKLTAENFNKLNVPLHIPMVVERHLKGVTIPNKEKHTIVTPVESIGVFYEFFKRGDGNPSFIELPLQQNTRRFPHHGEIVIAQGGNLRCMDDRINNSGLSTKTTSTQNYIVASFDLAELSVTSHLLTVGLPPIAVFESLANRFSRLIGSPIRFALGVSHANYSNFDPSQPLIEDTFRSHIQPPVANMKIHLVFDTDKPKALLGQLALYKNRIGGGSIKTSKFEYTNQIPAAQWLTDASFTYEKALVDNGFVDNDQKDILDKAIFLHELNMGYSISVTGFACLGLPDNSNDVGPAHTFSEPVFSIIQTQSVFDSAKAFWELNPESSEVLMYWGAPSQTTNNTTFEEKPTPTAAPTAAIISNTVTNAPGTKSFKVARHYFQEVVLPGYATNHHCELDSSSCHSFQCYALFKRADERFIVVFKAVNADGNWSHTATPEWQQPLPTASITQQILDASTCVLPSAVEWRELCAQKKQGVLKMRQQLNKIFETLDPSTELQMANGQVAIFKRKNTPQNFIGLLDGKPAKIKYEDISITFLAKLTTAMQESTN